MNFLELCQFVREQADLNGTGPTTVVGQTGEMGLVVRWTAQAWADIERRHQHRWNFLRKPLQFNTVQGQQEYTLAQMSAADLSALDVNSLRTYRAAAGISDEMYLVEWDWQEFYDTYLYGAQSQGRPFVFAVNPQNKALNVGSVPDDVYTIRGWYYRRPALPTQDTDVPAWPADMHELVAYRALVKYANFDAAPEVRQSFADEYRIMMDQLESDQLPKIGLGVPLA